MIQAQHISCKRNGRVLLAEASLTFGESEFVAIIGPNGAGKSTLLQLLSGYLKPDSGNVSLHGKALKEWPVADLAKQRAYLQQQQSVFESFSVEQVLMMGRSVHFRSLPAGTDCKLVKNALEELHLTERAAQPFNSLSGGEQQRVQFARTLLQLKDDVNADFRGKVLFLDEPLNNLDLHYQYNLLQLARNQVTRNGGCVIAVLHDLNMVSCFADRVIILSGGQILTDAPVEEALDPELLSAVYRMDIQKFQQDHRNVCFTVSQPSIVETNRYEEAWVSEEYSK